MISGFRDGLGFVVNIHDFPDRHAMTQHIRLTSTNRIPESDTRKFLFQGFSLEIKAAQSGNFQMSALRLTRKQGGMVNFDPTRLHNCWHVVIVVYNVNAIKPCVW